MCVSSRLYSPFSIEKINWKEIASILSKLTKKILITEFKFSTNAIASENYITKSWKNNYRLDNFLNALKLFYKKVKVVNLNDKNVRKIIICHK